MSESATFVLVGHCGADSWSLTNAIRTAVPGAKIVSASDEKSCTHAAQEQSVLLVNRVLDGNFSTGNGVDLIRKLAQVASEARLVLISNYADAQQAAVAAGAKQGFGKSQVGSAETAQLLRSLADS